MKMKIIMTTVAAIGLMAATVYLGMAGDDYFPRQPEAKAGNNGGEEYTAEVVNQFSFEEEVSDIVYGDPNADTRIVEFASYTCPFCRDFYLKVFPEVKEKLIDTGEVVFIYRNLPLDFISTTATSITNCYNGDKTKIIDIIYNNQDEILTFPEDEMFSKMVDYFSKRGVDITDNELQCARSKFSQENLILKMQKNINEYQLQATPTLIIGNTKLEGIKTYEEIEAALK